MCLAQGPQRSDAGEARTRGPSVSSQALYHWATALPIFCMLLLYILWYIYTTLTNLSTKYLMVCMVYTDVGGKK